MFIYLLTPVSHPVLEETMLGVSAELNELHMHK